MKCYQVAHDLLLGAILSIQALSSEDALYIAAMQMKEELYWLKVKAEQGPLSKSDDFALTRYGQGYITYGKRDPYYNADRGGNMGTPQELFRVPPPPLNDMEHLKQRAQVVHDTLRELRLKYENGVETKKDHEAEKYLNGIYLHLLSRIGGDDQPLRKLKATTDSPREPLDDAEKDSEQCEDINIEAAHSEPPHARPLAATGREDELDKDCID